jgi:hypothetical protein
VPDSKEKIQDTKKQQNLTKEKIQDTKKQQNLTKEKIQDTKDTKQQNLENKEEEEITGFPKGEPHLFKGLGYQMVFVL